MQFIKPNSVSGEILNLLDEANERVILVSPYCKFNKWYRLVNKIKDLKNRDIDVEFYVREGEKETIDQLESLGIEPICIPNLHCKLYLNEKYGIVTSMNLLLSSEINSLEIGYKTETKEEYDELVAFYLTYLNKFSDENNNDIDYNWIDDLKSILLDKIGRNRITINDNNLHVNTSSNNYDFFIWNDRKVNKLRMSGILSGSEFEYAKSIKENIILENLSLEFIDGEKGYYDSVWATFETELKASNINTIKSVEAKILTNPIVDFISKIEEIKDFHYKNRKIL